MIAKEVLGLCQIDVGIECRQVQGCAGISAR
jgi:hypothetical protein